MTSRTDQPVQQGTLRWDDAGDGYWLLRDGAAIVGEVYPRGAGYRWHCKLSDWRQMEATLADAKAALLASAEKEAGRAG